MAKTMAIENVLRDRVLAVRLDVVADSGGGEGRVSPPDVVAELVSLGSVKPVKFLLLRPPVPSKQPDFCPISKGPAVPSD